VSEAHLQILPREQSLANGVNMPHGFETAVIGKIARRILPLILVSYCVAHIDRANISVAALTMNRDLGLSAFAYGSGAGVFFLGYFLFEIPSNLILEAVGARRWIARIMFSWGLLSAACALVTGPTSFFAARFLLGVAEAGFFPGVVLYCTYWFPARYRGRIIAMLFLTGPIANGLSNIVSGAILGMNGVLGLRGWQWVFLIEAAPAIVLSFVVLWRMTDRPSAADWLKPDERQWLDSELDNERASAEAQGRLTLGKALLDVRVAALSAIYFLSVTASFGTNFFLPQIMKGFGLSNLMTGLVSAIPYLAGMMALWAWGWSSDRSGERRWHLIVASVIAAVGYAAAGMAGSSFWSLPAMCLAMIGIYGTRPPFWPLPSVFLSGRAAAGGIALINALYFVAACALASGAVAFFARRASDPRFGRRQELAETR
jgi:ACS family tartrate transporter-like MFS transporter